MALIFDLYYGEPGSAKTRMIIRLIQHMHETTGKIARVYTGDGSDIMYRNSGLIESGVIKMIQFAHRPWPFSVVQQICEGMWPVDEEAAESKFRLLTPEEVSNTGMWVIEGGSVIAEYMLGPEEGGLAHRAANGLGSLGQEAAIQFVDTGTGLKFGGNSGANYGTVQKHLVQNIKRTKAFPGIVIWTAHEKYDDGERGGAFAKGSTAEKYKMTDKIIGPEFGGKALTGVISRDFGNTLHFTTAAKKVSTGKNDPQTGRTVYTDGREYRVYTSDHFDPDGIVGLKYKAVVRAMNPGTVKDYYVSDPDKPGECLLQLYQDLKAANAK